MRDEIVSKKIALLAKEKGFNEITDLFFNSIYKNGIENVNSLSNYDNGAQRDNFCSLPTQSLLQRWLREVHNIHVNPSEYWETDMNSNKTGKILGYDCSVFSVNYDEIIGKHNLFTTYEQALEVALQEALKLIP